MFILTLLIIPVSAVVHLTVIFLRVNEYVYQPSELTSTKQSSRATDLNSEPAKLKAVAIPKVQILPETYLH